MMIGICTDGNRLMTALASYVSPVIQPANLISRIGRLNTPYSTQLGPPFSAFCRLKCTPARDQHTRLNAAAFLYLMFIFEVLVINPTNQ